MVLASIIDFVEIQSSPSVISGSETGSVSQDHLNQNGFSHEGNVKMGGWFHRVCYDHQKRYLYVMKNLQEI